MTYTSLRPEHLSSPIHGDHIDVQLDNGFTCTGSGRTRIYYDQQQNDWWFACIEGQHYLSGHLDTDEDGNLYFIGIFLDD